MFLFNRNKNELNVNLNNGYQFSSNQNEEVIENKLGEHTSYSTKEIYVNDIYGVGYIPNKEAKMPLVIFSHELGYNHSAGDDYAEYLASRGIAFYEFDFRNGGSSSKSGNDMSKMSVMTEVEDLEEVLEEARTWDFVDSSKIVLLGASQGGMVTGLTASRNQDKIAGEILMYAALLIPDDVHSRFKSLDEVPNTFTYRGWFTAGKQYVSDVWDIDVNKELSKYTGEVLLLHGTSDSIVPYSYSESANKAFQNSELHLIKGAGHGFYGRSFDEAITYIWNYLDKVL